MMSVTDCVMTIRVTKNYGAVVFYPACATSKLFAEIAGTKTLSRANLVRIVNMGFDIEYTHDTQGVNLP